MDASEIYPRRLHAKEALINQRDGKFVFSCGRCVDFTCLFCCNQTHFPSAVGHELVDPKMSNAFYHEGGFHVNSIWTRFNPVVKFGDIRVFQACTCDQRFDLTQVPNRYCLRTWRFSQVRLLPFSFLTTW